MLIFISVSYLKNNACVNCRHLYVTLVLLLVNKFQKKVQKHLEFKFQNCIWFCNYHSSTKFELVIIYFKTKQDIKQMLKAN